MQENELLSVGDAQIVAADFAAAHDLDDREARKFAETWFNQGENF